MAEFLREYSPNEGKPPKPWGRYVLAVLGVLIVAGGIYWMLRDRKESAQIDAFIADLKAKNYDAAYARWGCTPSKACPGYTKERFLQDWGPTSPAGKPESIKLSDSHSCMGSLIQSLDLGGGEKVVLIVNRTDKTLSFSPWKVCNPRINVN